jgi:hypothetical protein
MLKMMLVLIFTIKIAIVSSVCLTQGGTGYPSCQNLGNFYVGPIGFGAITIYASKRAEAGGLLLYGSTRNSENFGQCATACLMNSFCFYMDYNCKTGECIFYQMSLSGSNTVIDFTDTDHVSGLKIELF